MFKFIVKFYENNLKVMMKQFFCKHVDYTLYGEYIEDSEVFRGGSGKYVKM